MLENDRNKRVLVVDDDEAILRFVRILLQSSFEVKTALGGRRGLEELDGFKPDIVLLDLRMPDVDGPAFYREFRSRGFTAPVLIFSAFGASEAQEELGAQGSVAKPFGPEQLIQAIRNLPAEHF